MHISRRFCAWNIANSHHHSACLQTARTLSKSHFWTVTSWRPTNSIVNTFQRTLINAYVGVVIEASYPGHNTTVRSIFVSHRSLATTCENKLWKFFTTCRQVSTNIQLSVEFIHSFQNILRLCLGTPDTTRWGRTRFHFELESILERRNPILSLDLESGCHSHLTGS